MAGRRTRWNWLQPLAGAAVLVALLWQLGTGPFLDGVRAVDGRALAGAGIITLFVTACCAWRWRLVARGLGLELSFRAALGAYYSSQFLNSVLPGGILGDVHRGIVQGRSDGSLGRGLRTVAWERAAGQGVQLVLAVVVFALLPSPVHQFTGVLAGILLIALAAVLALARLRAAAGPQWWVRSLQTASSDIRNGLLTRGTGPGVVLASAAAVAGNAALFLVAARAAGTAGTTRQLLPLALFVLLAMSVPANIAGWGPREGAAAWAFSAAGLGAAQGLSAAVAYGILSLAACLPGAAVLAAAWFHNTRQRAGTPAWRAGTPAWREGPGPAGPPPAGPPPAGTPPTGKGGAPHA